MKFYDSRMNTNEEQLDELIGVLEKILSSIIMIESLFSSESPQRNATLYLVYQKDSFLTKAYQSSSSFGFILKSQNTTNKFYKKIYYIKVNKWESTKIYVLRKKHRNQWCQSYLWLSIGTQLKKFWNFLNKSCIILYKN